MISTDDFFIELINGSENDKSNNYQENYLVDESNHIMKTLSSINLDSINLEHSLITKKSVLR